MNRAVRLIRVSSTATLLFRRLRAWPRATFHVLHELDDVATVVPERPLRFERFEPNGGLKPYVRVRGRLEALCTRAVYSELVELAVAGGDEVGVWSGGVWWGTG